MAYDMLVVGLGNPGPEYANTRHNVGFRVLDELFSRTGGQSWQEKFKGLWSQNKFGSTSVLLLKPLTFMNLSGRSVSRAASYFGLEKEQILLIHDDLDLDFGIIRVKEGGGTGGHNGIASCKTELGGGDFLRVRVGIGRPVHGNATKFVLESFSTDEAIVLDQIIMRGADAAEVVIRTGTVKAMNEFNKRKQGDNNES